MQQRREGRDEREEPEGSETEVREGSATGIGGEHRSWQQEPAAAKAAKAEAALTLNDCTVHTSLGIRRRLATS